MEEFSSAGALVRTLSSIVSDPYGVATDAAGDVFVANNGNGTVEEFSSDGALLQTLSSGTNDPLSVATDAAGDVFVANQINSALEEFSPPARSCGSLAPRRCRPCSDQVLPGRSVATDAAGDVFVPNIGATR